MTGKEMRKLINGATCPQCGTRLKEPTKVKDVVTYGKCEPCNIYWEAWETPGNNVIEASQWHKLTNPRI